MRKYIPVLLIVLLCGCDIFTLREAEEPVKPPLWNSFYTTWQLALQNLEYAYEDERNLVKSSDLFMPNFRFYFSAQDINDYGISLIWTRDMERDMLYNLHNLADSINVVLDSIPGQNDDLQSTPIKLYRQYQVTVKKNGTRSLYEGKAEIQMQQESGFWRILNWYDYRTDLPSIRPTWGKLKHEYSV